MIANEALTVPSLQYGAFALCVLMLGFAALLWKSNRDDRKELGGLIGRKDAQILELTRDNAELLRSNTQAMRELAEALRARPCLSDDRVFRHGQLGERKS